MGDSNALEGWAEVLCDRDDLEGLTALSKERPEPGVFLQLAWLHARRGDVDQAELAWCRAEPASPHGPARSVLADIGRLDPEWAARRWRDWAADHTIRPLRLVWELDALGLRDEAITECRECLAQDISDAAYHLVGLYDKRGDDDATRRVLDELPDLEQVKYHPAARRLLGMDPTPAPPADIRTTAARLRKAQDLYALRQHAEKYPDKVVRRYLTELLLERGHEDEARTLAETSNGANRAYTAFLVGQARWPDLGRLVAEGNHQASWALRAYLNDNHDLDETARRIKRHGLMPDGAVAG